VEVYIHRILDSAADGGERAVWLTAAFLPWKEPPYPFYRWVIWQQNILNILENTKSLFLAGYWTKNVWTCNP